MRRCVAELGFALCLVVLVLAGLPLLAAPSGRAVYVDSSAPTVLFAGVASAPGVNNTQWRSEAVLTNGADATADVLLELVPRGESGVVASLALSLGPGETRRIPDVYTTLNAPSGAGTLRVTGDVLAWVRTFNQGSSGTFGQDVPPATADTAFAPATPVLFPISTPADVKTEFRSNLLLLNLEATTVTFTLSSGSVSKTYDVPAGVFAQISGIGTWLGLPPGRSMLSVSGSGKWSGMIATVDPVLGDPTTVRGLVATTRSVTQFSGVASAGGVNDTQWRSEATLYNPRMSPQGVTLELIPRGASSVSSGTSLTLAPLEVRRLSDVYTALGAASGAGTLRVTGDVMTWIRTFNQGAGATFGQDVPEVVPGVAHGRGAGVSFPATTPADVNRDFRSNLLVTNHETATITLTISSGTASRTLEVPAGTFLQQNNVGAWLGLQAGVSTLTVTGTGRWTGMVATIDPFLGDPTTMIGVRTTGNTAPRTAGTASGNAATATIGPAGGTLASADGRLVLTVPPGAVPAPTAFSIQPITNSAPGGIGSAYRLGPAGTSFSSPATITFTANTDDTKSVSPEALAIGYHDGEGYWRWLSNAVTNPAARSVSVGVSKIAAAAAGAGRDALAPDGGRQDYSMLSGLVLTPSSASVKEGESLQLTIKECLPPKVVPLEPDPLEPLVFECDTYPFYKVPTSFWAVNGVAGGNGTFGTVDGFMTHGTFTAPSKAPSPPTVAVSAQVSQYLTYHNLSLISQVTIGGGLHGTFTLNESSPTGVRFSARGEAELTPFVSDANGVAYDMTGTITVDASFPFYGQTCSCVDSRTKPIPADATFSIQRKPTLGQRWVMGAVSWNFVCNPGSVPMFVFIQYLVSQAQNCSQPVWLPLSDERHPTGSFNYTCGQGFTVDGSWDFSSD